jgi:hypothetical protein
MLFHRVVVELLLTLTLWLQSAGVASLITWVRHVLQNERHTMGAFWLAALVVRLATAVVVLHGLEILIWQVSTAGFVCRLGTRRCTSQQTVIQHLAGVA